MTAARIPLRYGMNPHQKDAALAGPEPLPLAVRNGAPGFINLLDALNGWQLVRELRQATGLAAAASFKHVSPSGAAVAVPLDDTLRRAYATGADELSPLATAYARARGTDRLASFGDFVALSDPLDLATALLLSREVSDGVIAPGYAPEALAVLAKKRAGAYVCLEIDPTYEPAVAEARTVFGLELTQQRNQVRIDRSLLGEVPTRRKLDPESERDLLVGIATMKYTQSNSVCLTKDGQTIGVGAGQQSRIDCVRLAASKAERWRLRQHPDILGVRFAKGTGRPDRDNAIDELVRRPFAGREAWLAAFGGVALASDGFFPFRDSIDAAARAGVSAVAQPGGSARDAEVVAACDEHAVAMAMTRTRLFHH